MWEYIKRGFGYAFGGRIGWELGGVVWRFVTGVGKLMLISMIGLGAAVGASCNKAEEAAAAKKPAAIHKTIPAKPAKPAGAM